MLPVLPSVLFEQCEVGLRDCPVGLSVAAAGKS